MSQLAGFAEHIDFVHHVLPSHGLPMFPVSDKQLQSSDDVAAFDKIGHAACIVLPRSFEDQPERLKAFEEAAADLDGGASNSVFRTVVRIKDALVSNAIEPTLFKSFSIV